MKQGKKRKDHPDEDLFEFNSDKNENEISFGSEIEEKDIPQDTLFNKMGNCYRLNKD